ncbi:MAG: transcriptional regulator NrdR [Bdellovibrionales bacterium]
MKCPECGNNTTRVQDSRPAKDNTSVRRRRSCTNCSLKFLTEEVVVLDLPMVVKKDGRREPFSRAKIEKGLYASCQKRPISKQQIDGIVSALLDRISRRGSPELHSDMIGRYVMAELRKLDEVAYVRFASVYMTFKEVNEFFESIGSDIV